MQVGGDHGSLSSAGGEGTRGRCRRVGEGSCPDTVLTISGIDQAGVEAGARFALFWVKRLSGRLGGSALGLCQSVLRLVGRSM